MFQDLVLPILTPVVHEYNDFSTVGIRYEVHGTSHTLHDFLRDHVIRKIPRRRNFQSLKIPMEIEKPRIRGGRLTPSIATSMWPPRIIPKLSSEPKVEAPGRRVTVSFPALMMFLFGIHETSTDYAHPHP